VRLHASGRSMRALVKEARRQKPLARKAFSVLSQATHSRASSRHSGSAANLIEIVQHADHRAAFLVPALHQIEQVRRSVGVNGGEGLIEQDKRGILYQKPRKTARAGNCPPTGSTKGRFSSPASPTSQSAFAASSFMREVMAPKSARPMPVARWRQDAGWRAESRAPVRLPAAGRRYAPGPCPRYGYGPRRGEDAAMALSSVLYRRRWDRQPR